MTRLRPWLLCMALSIGVRTARAEGEPATFSLDYSAPQGCPSRAQFIDAIVSRTPTAHETPRAEADVAFTARLTSVGTAATSGELWVEPSSEAGSRREVGPATCPEIIESMAVIAALILAGGEPPPPPETSQPEADPPVVPKGPVPTEQPPPVPPVPPTAPPEANPPAPVVLETPDPDESAPEPEPPGTMKLRTGLALHGGLNNAVGPSVSFTGRGALGLWLMRPGVWSPRVRVGGEYSQSRREPTDPGSAAFRLLALDLELCPVRLPKVGPLAARPCAALQTGQLRADADGTEGQPQTRTMPWLGAGARVNLEAEILSRLSLEGALGAMVLSRADTFTVEPSGETVHQVPRIALSFLLGMAIWLP